MLGISVAALVMRSIYVALALGAAVYVADVIGDRREAKVHARYAKAFAKTNVKVADFNSVEDALEAVAAQSRQQALEDARKTAGPKHRATPEQAEALSRIK